MRSFADLCVVQTPFLHYRRSLNRRQFALAGSTTGSEIVVGKCGLGPLDVRPGGGGPLHIGPFDVGVAHGIPLFSWMLNDLPIGGADYRETASAVPRLRNLRPFDIGPLDVLPVHVRHSLLHRLAPSASSGKLIQRIWPKFRST